MLTTSLDLFEFISHTRYFLINAYRSDEYTTINTDDFISLLYIADRLPKKIGVRNPHINLHRLLWDTKREKSPIQTVALVKEIIEVLNIAELAVKHFEGTRIERYIKEAHEEISFNNYANDVYSVRIELDLVENTIDDAMIALIGELGATANTYKKIKRGDFSLKSKKEDLVEGLGDVLWNLNDLCFQLGTSLEEIAVANLEKLNKTRLNHVEAE